MQQSGRIKIRFVLCYWNTETKKPKRGTFPVSAAPYCLKTAQGAVPLATSN